MQAISSFLILIKKYRRNFKPIVTLGCIAPGLSVAMTSKGNESLMSKTKSKFSPEVRAKAARIVLDHKREYPSRWPAALSIWVKIGCSAHPLLH
jgi:hypothetical protein